jgi:hypothetical protein
VISYSASVNGLGEGGRDSGLRVWKHKATLEASICDRDLSVQCLARVVGRAAEWDINKVF